MKVKITFLALALIIFASCKEESHKEIRNAFRQYVTENFGNPKDMKEITNVELKDTTSLGDIVNTAKELLNVDSIANQYEDKFFKWAITDENNRSATLKILSSKYKDEYWTEIKAIGRKLDTYDRYNIAKTTFKEKLREAEGIIDYYIHYVIKARIEVNGIKEVREYHAYVDKNGKIQVKDREMKTTDLPKYWTELGDAIEAFSPYPAQIANRQVKLKEILTNCGFSTDKIYN